MRLMTHHKCINAMSMEGAPLLTLKTCEAMVYSCNMPVENYCLLM